MDIVDRLQNYAEETDDMNAEQLCWAAVSEIEMMRDTNSTIRAIGLELLEYVIADIKDGDHSGSDDPDDYELVVRAMAILTQNATGEARPE